MSVLLEKKRIFLVNNFIQDNTRFIFITNYRNSYSCSASFIDFNISLIP